MRLPVVHGGPGVASVGRMDSRSSTALARLFHRRVAAGLAMAVTVAVVARLSGAAEPRALGSGFVAFLAIMALGGALGGVVFHYLEPFRHQGRAWGIAVNLAGAFAYCVIVAVAFALGTL